VKDASREDTVEKSRMLAQISRGYSKTHGFFVPDDVLEKIVTLVSDLPNQDAIDIARPRFKKL
jgi:hypothetical protein